MCIVLHFQKVHKIWENCYFYLGYVALMHSYFMHFKRNSKHPVLLEGILNVHFMNIGFDIIVNALAGIFHADL